MAQLKDALVTGDVRVLGKLYANQSLPDGVFHLANIGGTAAVTTSPYTSAKWYTTVNDPRITSLYSGLTISLKIPVAGHGTYGTLLDVNGLGYHPVVYNVNSNISTRYGVGGTIILTYNATQTANGYNNSDSATTYTGCWQLEDYDYDSTNIYQLRENNAGITVGSSAGSLYRYEFCFVNKNHQLIPYNNTSNARTTYTKALNSQSFDPFAPIYYYNSTTTVAAGANAGASTLMTHVNVDCRYSMNINSDGTSGSTALTDKLPVYVVASYSASTGLATLVNNTSATSYLDRSSIVQAFPATELEGKILIYLGRASSKYQIELSVTHPVYKWDSAKSAWMEFSCTAENAATVNGHSVEIDVPTTAKLTDTNTTYTFANGTNGFSVTPSGGTAQTVTVTPSIANNITGSGTNGYLTKFNGANTVTNGPQLGSSTSTYLRNDATWVNPQNVYVGSSAPSGSNYQVWIDTNGADDFTAIINAVYPIGSIYMSVSSTNPATIFGVGTWVAWGSGRVPVGVDTNQSSFNTVEKTGGENSHQLTVAEMPAHAHSSTYNTAYDSGTTGWGARIVTSDTFTFQITNLSNICKNTGGNEAHNNLQPYITCYMWKRTA